VYSGFLNIENLYMKGFFFSPYTTKCGADWGVCKDSDSIFIGIFPSVWREFYNSDGTKWTIAWMSL